MVRRQYFVAGLQTQRTRDDVNARSRIGHKEQVINVGVDIRGLTFIDAGGRKLLMRMYAEGATFTAKGLVKETVEDITRECEDSRKNS